MSLKNLHYALLLDEQRKNLKPEEKKLLREQIRKDSKVVVKKLMDVLEKAIDTINETEN